jgi:hypothetical protein
MLDATNDDQYSMLGWEVCKCTTSNIPVGGGGAAAAASCVQRFFFARQSSQAVPRER